MWAPSQRLTLFVADISGSDIRATSFWPWEYRQHFYKLLRPLLCFFLSSTISTQFIQVCALIWPSGYFLKHCNLLYACCNQVNLINNVKAHSQYINYMNYLYCPYSVYVYYINKNIYVEVVCMWLTMMKLKSVNLCGLNCEYIVLTTVLLKIQGPDTSCEMNWLTYIHFPHWEIKNQYNEICKRILSVSY